MGEVEIQCTGKSANSAAWRLALFRLSVLWDDMVKSSRSLDSGAELNGGQKTEWKSMER